MPRALIVDPAFLGDVVFDGPLARALQGDGYEVGIVVRPPADAVARRMTHVDHVHVFDKRGVDRGWRGMTRVAQTIAGGRYEVAYVPHPSPRSAIVAARARIPRRIGAEDGGPFAKVWMTERRAIPPGQSFVADRLALYEGAADLTLAGVMRRRTSRFRGDRARVGLTLGSAWATKRWPPARAAELVAHLKERVQWVWIGAPWEAELFRELVNAGAAGAEDRTDGDVDAMIDAVESCDVVVGGDTGPVHLARALSIPVVALFGPTPEARHDFAEADRVLAEVMDCRPCSAHGDDKCPLGHHDCLEKLSGTRVGGAVVEVLDRS